MAYATHKERIWELAERQQGRLTVAQLHHLGVAPWTVALWIEQGRLRAVLPRVYAVGHTAPNREADLWAAVLYAGPGAMLSHGTAAYWRGLVDYPPRVLQVSTPRQVQSLENVRVYGRRDPEREFHKGLPVTSIPATMVGLAATSGPRVVIRALGQLDFQRLLDVDSLLAACGSGRRGAKRLREAIDAYDPRRKYANGRLEDDFYALCKRRGLPLPRLNTSVHDIKVDAYWPEQRLVVELDSELAHSSPPRRRRDRRNDLILRSHGLTVHRYDWELVHQHAAEVCQDVLSALERTMTVQRVQVR
jgi:very-short-patch-repair endonuclease